VIVTVSKDEMSKLGVFNCLGLMGDNYAGTEFPSGCFGAEITDERENESGCLCKGGSIVAKIRPQSFRNGKDELSVWQIQDAFLRSDALRKGGYAFGCMIGTDRIPYS